MSTVKILELPRKRLEITDQTVLGEITPVTYQVRTTRIDEAF
jgi:hypothetical protein